MTAVRIWYQSFVDPEQHAPYFGRLREYLTEIADPGIEFEVGGVSPPDTALHRITEFRCAAQAIANTIAAEDRGFDAVLIGHFQDSGLYEARASVDIPVVGMGEATMLYACQLGATMGLVTIDPVFVPIHWEQVVRYGLRERVTGVVATATSVAGLVAAFEDRETYTQALVQFREQARPLVDAGAEVIVPAGGLFGLLTARERGFRIGAATVLNPIATSVKTVELAAKLRALNGTAASRVAAFAKPPAKALEEFAAFLTYE